MGINFADPFFDNISFSMERPSSSVLQVMITLAPSDANNLNVAAPIPLPPPVTITVFL